MSSIQEVNYLPPLWKVESRYVALIPSIEKWTKERQLESCNLLKVAILAHMIIIISETGLAFINDDNLDLINKDLFYSLPTYES